MIEAQHGAAMFRLHARNPLVIEYQPGPRLRWRTHSRWPDETAAEKALWRLARGEDVQPIEPNTAQEAT